MTSAPTWPCACSATPIGTRGPSRSRRPPRATSLPGPRPARNRPGPQPAPCQGVSALSMKRTLTALAAAVAALLAVAAAPALALQPAPVDFSKAAEGARGSLTTAKRFNVVGLRWGGRARPHVHLRVRQAHSG